MAEGPVEQGARAGRVPVRPQPHYDVQQPLGAERLDGGLEGGRGDPATHTTPLEQPGGQPG
jgi:hypothetical protein